MALDPSKVSELVRRLHEAESKGPQELRKFVNGLSEDEKQALREVAPREGL